MNYTVVVAVRLYDFQEQWNAKAILQGVMGRHGLSPSVTNIFNRGGQLVEADLPSGMFIGCLLGESAEAVRADVLAYCTHALNEVGLTGEAFTFVVEDKEENSMDIGFTEIKGP